MAQRAKLISLQTCAFEQAVEEQWKVEGVGVASRQRQFDTVFFDASQGRAERLIALTDRGGSGLGQGHVVLQQVGGKQQFYVAGRDGFGGLDHAQGFDELPVGADSKAQAKAW